MPFVAQGGGRRAKRKRGAPRRRPAYERTFLYKIYSGYNGFTPSRLPIRIRRKSLSLGWRQYIEVVEPKDQVWVYFHGSPRFREGVYIKARVRAVNVRRKRVVLRVVKFSTEKPLSGKKITKRIARAVATRGRQVFLVRSMEADNPLCTPQRCALHRCGSCPVWRRMHLVTSGEYTPSKRISSLKVRVLPAYWVVPTRSYILPRKLKLRVLLSSEVFYEFKAGQGDLAYPLARGIWKVLKKRKLRKFQCIVPIPLSPDKQRQGELNRTLALSEELCRLTNTPVRKLLSLSSAVSKRRWQSRGRSIAEFRNAYRSRLRVKPSACKYDRILLVDDVCTHGNTIALAASAIQKVNPEAEIAAATAGQMITKSSVKNEQRIKRRLRRG